MKKRILVDLPDNLIDEETKKLIKTQKNKIAALQTQVNKLEYLLDEQKAVVERAKKLVEAVQNAGEFSCGYGD